MLNSSWGRLTGFGGKYCASEEALKSTGFEARLTSHPIDSLLSLDDLMDKMSLHDTADFTKGLDPIPWD